MFRRNFPRNWKSSEHLTTAAIPYDFVRTAAQVRDITSLLVTARPVEIYSHCLHKAMVFGIVFRLLIVASIKRSLQGHPCSNASCIPITVPFSSITRIATLSYDCLRQLNRRPTSRTSFRRCRKTKKKRGEQHLKRLQLRKAIGPPLKKAGLTSANCLPCQNDNKFLITERS